MNKVDDNTRRADNLVGSWYLPHPPFLLEPTLQSCNDTNLRSKSKIKMTCDMFYAPKVWIDSSVHMW